jgi:hypothetical protein
VQSSSQRSHGFIVTSTGIGSGGGIPGMGGGGSGTTSDALAFIMDADGDVVWWTAAPSQCSRALMNYEGTDMWMVAQVASAGSTVLGDAQHLPNGNTLVTFSTQGVIYEIDSTARPRGDRA